MFDLSTVRLMHPHGDEMVPMTEVSRQTFHDSAEFDPERDLLRSSRIFKCPVCDERVSVAPTASPADKE